MAETRNTPPLAGVRVLVTRPAHQAEPLARLIEQAGGSAIRFPTLAIAPPQALAALYSILDRLAEFDLAIFISPNAVEQGLALLAQRGLAWPASMDVAGVGMGTVQALAHRGIGRVVAPERRYDSEGLLEHPALAQIAGRRVVIFRGEGGRELLGRTLTERGAAVTYAECYRRVRPDVDVAPMRERLARGEIDIISVTSTEGLRNLYDMIGDAGRAPLIKTPVVVLSESQAAVSRTLGFGAPLVAAGASDTAILDAIEAWRAPRISL